jgi:hypothetical protein
MSVWKETWKELEEIAEAQHRLYDDACDYGFWANDARNGSDDGIADRSMVTKLRNFIRENKESGTVTKSQNFIAGSRFGWWKFELEMLEAIDDGFKVGITAVVSVNNSPKGTSLTLDLKDPNSGNKMFARR